MNVNNKQPADCIIDMLHTCREMKDILRDRTVEEYANDRMIRGAVERLLVTLWSAYRRLKCIAPDIAMRIDGRTLIRRLGSETLHHYWAVDNKDNWSFVNGPDRVALMMKLEMLIRELNP